MRLRLAAAGAALALAGAAPAEAKIYRGSATAYHSCDGSTSRQANGTRAHWGEVANNWLPLGTWIEMVRPARVGGRKFFRVEDRGGGGFVLDFYAKSCGWMNWWGRRRVTFRVVPRSELTGGRPMRAEKVRIRRSVRRELPVGSRPT